jgi:hypothetical protein
LIAEWITSTNPTPEVEPPSNEQLLEDYDAATRRLDELYFERGRPSVLGNKLRTCHAEVDRCRDAILSKLNDLEAQVKVLQEGETE